MAYSLVLGLDVVPVTRGGFVDLSALESLLGPDVLLVSVVAANGETGVINPLQEIADLVRSVDALFHSDATQLVGWEPLDMEGVADRPTFLEQPQDLRRAQQFGAAHLDRRRWIKFHSKWSRVAGGDVMRRGAAGAVWTQKLTDEERVNPALAVSTYTVYKDVR